MDLDLFHQWQVENPRRNRPVELVLHDSDLCKRLALAKLFRDWSDEEILYQDQRLQPTSFAQIASNEPCEMIGRHVQLLEHYQNIIRLQVTVNEATSMNVFQPHKHRLCVLSVKVCHSLGSVIAKDRLLKCLPSNLASCFLCINHA
jgi:hypothetical protein